MSRFSWSAFSGTKFSATRTKRAFRRVLKWMGFSVLGMTVLFFLLHFLFPLPDRVEYSTIITDNKGDVIHSFLTRDQKWRMKTEIDEISPLLQKAIVAKEDRHFYRHPGVNPFAIVRAFFNNIFGRGRTSGASTITMQVAKALEPGKRNIWTKIRESFRALQLELKYSKKEILQLYLNLVPYGGNIEGVKAAALIYFGKAPDHLSIAEITALSIMPNKPSLLVPGRHNERIVEERNYWLKKFAREKVFTQTEIEDALNEPFLGKRRAVPRLAPHLSYRLKPLGDIVKTHLDMNTQLKLEKIVSDYARVQRLKGVNQAAVVVLDNQTHQVITYIGSANFYDSTDGGQVNGAAAVRQPGSTLKPLLYALCFDEGLLTPKTVMTDAPVNYEGYTPENYDARFNGYVTVEKSLEYSLNIPAVKALRLLGTDRMISTLSRGGFRQVQRDRRKLGLSMALGGCGTTLEELTGLFSAFAMEGKYFTPLLHQKEQTGKGDELVSPAASFMINEILTRIHRPDFPVNWSATEHMPRIAWKTGTSYGRKDAWSVGYNKRFTVGVWLGNFSGQGAPGLSGTTVATPLLFRIFNTIDYDSDASWFEQPKDCDIRQVCGETGLPPAASCNARTMDYFIPLVSSTRTCENRQEVLLSYDEKVSYCRACVPESGYKKKSIRVVEPEMQAWYQENKIAFERVPPHFADCEIVFRGAAPVISFPVNGTEYLISKKNPEPLQLTCRTSNDVSRVYWYINDRFFKSAAPGEKQFFMPEEGLVKISCSDDKGRNRNIRITVKKVNL